MYYKGLFFENKEQLNKAKRLLEKNNIICAEDSTYDQFFVQEAIAQLENLDIEFTNKDVNELAYCIRECEDSVIDSELVNEITESWLVGERNIKK